MRMEGTIKINNLRFDRIGRFFSDLKRFNVMEGLDIIGRKCYLFRKKEAAGGFVYGEMRKKMIGGFV